MAIDKKVFLTLDTETCGLAPNNLVYDVAYNIHDKAGEIAQTRSFAIREIITNPQLMMGAFYAGKIFSHYIPTLYNRDNLSLVAWADFVATLRADVASYNVGTIAAYNARFDMGALRATNAAIMGADAAKILTGHVDILCIWNFACRVLLNRPTYSRLAHAEKWVSDAGNIRTTAEHTFRYISGDYAFIESHTALHDANIETEILAQCFRQKKRIPYNEYPADCWRVPQAAKVVKQMMLT